MPLTAETPLVAVASPVDGLVVDSLTHHSNTSRTVGPGQTLSHSTTHSSAALALGLASSREAGSDRIRTGSGLDQIKISPASSFQQMGWY